MRVCVSCCLSVRQCQKYFSTTSNFYKEKTDRFRKVVNSEMVKKKKKDNKIYLIINNIYNKDKEYNIKYNKIRIKNTM